LALAWGCPSPKRLTVSAPLARARHHREKMAVTEGGREAVTHVSVDACWPAGAPEPLASLLRCRLETGRTHQIRVHLASIRHPILGDKLYGSGFQTKAALLSEPQRAALTALDRQALHAAVLGFAHPANGKVLRFESPPPPDMAALIAAFGNG